LALIQNSESSQKLIEVGACLASIPLDYIGRQKLGGIHYNLFIIKQIPIVQSDQVTRYNIFYRVLELTYTSYDMKPFAEDIWAELYPDAATRTPLPEPFIWNEKRRFKIRCELDAIYFHLYGINRDDADYILETFPIVKRKDIARFGEYRTKNLILEIYDAMQQAKESGQSYQTILDPPPADLWVTHKK